MKMKELTQLLDWVYDKGIEEGSDFEKALQQKEVTIRAAVRKGRVLEARRNGDEKRVLDLIGGADE